MQLQRQLDQFRSTQPHRTKLPETLAGRSGTGAGARSDPGAHPLRREYMGLTRRLEGLPTAQKKAAAPAVVRPVASHPATMSECVIEFESSIGGKMRIQWKGSSTPDWAILLRAWREAER